ncbi:hypothetical protein SAMN04488540_1062 [Ferrimonas sediminum]|uniref:Uncharacterized protein n=1 Tax=Ferrimonas sediminum TaxID=718193 RepID=A0A1G8RWF8_9GAMM|nr:hypothetical protein [Ferrimonas sediminum]SDJ21249.1 hypothetical protein SAMN04488540_1062 [Ferrimonas sediminum]
MLDAVCTHGGEVCTYNIFDFQKLDPAVIELKRQHLQCPNPDCTGKAYYRRASIDGKAACFGSRYHIAGCDEGRSSEQGSRELQQAQEVRQLLLAGEEVRFDFSPVAVKGRSEPVTPLAATKADTRPGSSPDKVNKSAKPASIGMDKALASLMRGSGLDTSETVIQLDGRFNFKAKNLFVNFADAEPQASAADVKPKMFWGTISHTDADLEWLNPSDCDDVGIPIARYKKAILARFGITDRRDLEGAGLILYGKCFWNRSKTRKIIELWDAERIFISVLTD